MESAGEILKRSLNSKSLKNTGTSSNADLPQDAAEASGQGKPDCPHCGGLGYVIPNVPPAHPSFGRAVVCSCRAVDREMARMSQLQKLSQLGALDSCTFETFLPEGHGLSKPKQLNLKRAYDWSVDYAKEPKGWLIIKGGYGCGKTHLAAAIANYRLSMGHPVLFVSTPDLLDHLRAAYAPGATVSYDQRFDQVRNAPMLILDDLGTQSNSDWAVEKLYQIFNHRYNARLPTIVTTNQEIDSFESRIRSRLEDISMVQVIHILAPDFRRGGSTRNNQTFLR